MAYKHTEMAYGLGAKNYELLIHVYTPRNTESKHTYEIFIDEKYFCQQACINTCMYVCHTLMLVLASRLVQTM